MGDLQLVLSIPPDDGLAAQVLMELTINLILGDITSKHALDEGIVGSVGERLERGVILQNNINGHLVQPPSHHLSLPISAGRFADLHLRLLLRSAALHRSTALRLRRLLRSAALGLHLLRSAASIC